MVDGECAGEGEAEVGVDMTNRYQDSRFRLKRLSHCQNEGAGALYIDITDCLFTLSADGLLSAFGGCVIRFYSTVSIPPNSTLFPLSFISRRIQLFTEFWSVQQQKVKQTIQAIQEGKNTTETFG